MLSWWACVWAVLQKDLRTEWRTKERLGLMGLFVLLTLLVFNFAFELGGAALHETGAGVLWSSYVFACLLGLNRSFADERENGCLEALQVAPVPPSALYFAKMLANLLFLAGVQALSVPVFALFYNLSPGLYLLPLAAVLLAGAAALAAVGTLFAAASGHLRLRELLLPLLLLPLVMPVMIACVGATRAILRHEPLIVYAPYLRMLAVFIVVYVTLSLMVFARVTES